MQDGTLASYGYGKGISKATDKYADHGSSSGGYRIKRRKKEMTIPNNPECLSQPLGDECRNTAKVKLGAVGVGRRQQ